MSIHILPIRVYYEDTDVGGIVYHPNYLKYCERARTEFLRAKGYDLVNLKLKHNLQFVIHSAKLEYLQPARLDQLLYVVSEIEKIGSASMQFVQEIYIATSDKLSSTLQPTFQTVEGAVGGFLQKKDLALKQLCCRAEIRLACVDDQFRPTGLPSNFSMELKQCLQINH
jgi:tol-pal system-associated acyl-CoA thioesterase